jgi:hypothetical protein
MRRKSVVNSVKWVLFVITNLSFWLSCHSISSSCYIIHHLPRKLRQKQINRQIFFFSLMKLSPFFFSQTSHSFIHIVISTSHIFTFFMNFPSIVCSSLHSFYADIRSFHKLFFYRYTLQIFCMSNVFFFSFSFYKAIFIFYPRCPLREIVLLSVVIIRVVAERLW